MRNLIISLLLSLCASTAWGAKASWITAADDSVNRPNTWIAFQKDVVMKTKPRSLKARIACDSKYWLWVNGNLVVFEGSLKRGPAPGEGYYDEIDLGRHLQRGHNRVAVLVCYFGRSGFSHEDSGKSGLYIDSDNAELCTNASWMSRIHPAYATATGEMPNFRLSESNISYDARHAIDGWQTADVSTKYGFTPSVEIGAWGDRPWGRHTLRPIPMFKDFGVKAARFELHEGARRDTVIAFLPGNLQVTPVIDLTATQGGDTIDIWTNHSHMAGA